MFKRAHRTPARPRMTQVTKPRPIHVAFLRYEDRQLVIKSARNLKDFPIPNARVIVAEDLTPKLQAERRELLNARKGRKVFVNCPAYLRIVESDGTITTMKASEL